MLKTVLNPLNTSEEVALLIENSFLTRTLLKQQFTGSEAILPAFLTSLMGGKLSMTEEELKQCAADFIAHYRPANLAADFAPPIHISWIAFRNAALSYGIPVDQLAVHFIHRYNATTDKWFLTVEFCTLGTTGTTVPGGTEYPLTHNGNFIDLNTDSITTTNQADLDSDGQGVKYGHDYHNAMQYSANGTNFSPLNMNNTRGCTFAWFELATMFKHNCTDRNRDENQMKICFTSISSDYSGSSGLSIVAFPHGISMHMLYYNDALLNNGDLIVGSYFEDKAADLQTLCPPNCIKYIWPDGLTLFVS